MKRKSWNPKGCVIEYAKKKRGPRKWISFASVTYTLNEATEKIVTEFRTSLPEFIFRVRVP